MRANRLDPLFATGQVRQKAYELAMTVVMENHLDSIVVDNMATVQKCLEYLKEQKISAKTFLPLDSIKVKEPDQKLRELQDQKVKLALDLLEFEEPTRKAMLYACGDALVTDTLEQAKELAYSKNSNFRVKVTRVFHLFRLLSLTRIHQSAYSCSACS